MVGAHHIIKIQRDDLTWEAGKLDVHIDPRLLSGLRHFLSCYKFVETDLCCVLWIDITVELLVNEVPDQQHSQNRYYSSYIG